MQCRRTTRLQLQVPDRLTTHMPCLSCNTHQPHNTRAILLRVSVAVLLELTELAKPVEMPCLCCNTRAMQEDYAAFPPNQTFAARDDFRQLVARSADEPLSEKELCSVLPPDNTSCQLLQTLAILSAYRFDSMGSYDKAYQAAFSKDTAEVFEDRPDLLAVIADFGAALKAVEQQMDGEDAARVGRGLPSYPYLKPSLVLNSISI